MQKAPDRCNRVVWGAAMASATVNFAHEYADGSHNLVAGGYLALLSLFGMVMFHEFLDQFEEGTAYIKRESPKFGLRWFTWPTNTFCAAVAWRNHPPVDGTPAGVREALANLDRVRQLKQVARQAEIDVRHQRALARARRRAERAAARAGTFQGRAAVDDVGHELDGGLLDALADSMAAVPDAVRLTVPPSAGVPTAVTFNDLRGSEVKVPVTAATVRAWAATWVSMCTEGTLVFGPINNDEEARVRFNLSAKQLRNIRNAAMSGALRRRADELGVPLPDGYVDRPVLDRINRHVSAMTSA